MKPGKTSGKKTSINKRSSNVVQSVLLTERSSNEGTRSENFVADESSASWESVPSVEEVDTLADSSKFVNSPSAAVEKKVMVPESFATEANAGISIPSSSNSVQIDSKPSSSNEKTQEASTGSLNNENNCSTNSQSFPETRNETTTTWNNVSIPSTGANVSGPGSSLLSKNTLYITKSIEAFMKSSQFSPAESIASEQTPSSYQNCNEETFLPDSLATAEPVVSSPVVSSGNLTL